MRKIYLLLSLISFLSYSQQNKDWFFGLEIGNNTITSIIGQLKIVELYILQIIIYPIEKYLACLIVSLKIPLILTIVLK